MTETAIAREKKIRSYPPEQVGLRLHQETTDPYEARKLPLFLFFLGIFSFYRDKTKMTANLIIKILDAVSRR